MEMVRLCSELDQYVGGGVRALEGEREHKWEVWVVFLFHFWIVKVQLYYIFLFYMLLGGATRFVYILLIPTKYQKNELLWCSRL